MTKTRKIAFLGLVTACAIILSYIEMLLPPLWSAIPGIKIGFSNIVILYILYCFSFKEAGLVSIIRIVVVSILFGNVMTFWYSIAGALLSITVMTVLKKSSLFSTIGVSIAGAVAHNLGQILVAMLLLRTGEIGYYMIVLSVTGILSGIAVGLAGALLLKYLDRIRI